MKTTISGEKNGHKITFILYNASPEQVHKETLVLKHRLEQLT